MSGSDASEMTDKSRIGKHFAPRGPDGPADPRFHEMKRWRISASSFIDWLPLGLKNRLEETIKEYEKFMPFRAQMQRTNGFLETKEIAPFVKTMLQYGVDHEPNAMHAFKRLFTNCNVESIGSQYGRSHEKWNYGTETYAEYRTARTTVSSRNCEGGIPHGRLRGGYLVKDEWTYAWKDQLVATTDAVTDNHDEDIKNAFNGVELKCPAQPLTKNNAKKPIFFLQYPKQNARQTQEPHARVHSSTRSKWLLQMFIQLEVHPEFKYIDFMAWKEDRNGEEYVFPARLYRYAVDEMNQESSDHNDTRYAALKKTLEPYIAEFARMSERLRNERYMKNQEAREDFTARVKERRQRLEQALEGWVPRTQKDFSIFKRLKNQHNAQNVSTKCQYLSPYVPSGKDAIEAALREWCSNCMAYCSTNVDLSENDVWCTLQPPYSDEAREQNNQLIGKINMVTGEVYRIDVVTNPGTQMPTTELCYADKPDPEDAHYTQYFGHRFESGSNTVRRKPVPVSRIREFLYVITRTVLEQKDNLKIQVNDDQSQEIMSIWSCVLLEDWKKFVEHVWKRVNILMTLGFKPVPYEGPGPSQEENPDLAEKWKQLKEDPPEELSRIRGIDLDERMGVLMKLDAVEWEFLPLFSRDVVQALKNITNIDKSLEYVQLAKRTGDASVKVENVLEEHDDYEIRVSLQYYSDEEIKNYKTRGVDVTTKKPIMFVETMVNAMMALGFVRRRYMDKPNSICAGLLTKQFEMLSDTLKTPIQAVFQDELDRAIQSRDPLGVEGE